MKNSEEIFLDELKNEFIEKLQKDIRSMELALEDGRHSDIARMAHDIKGTIGIFGYHEGTHLALNLQLAAEEDRKDLLKDTFYDFMQYLRSQKIIQ